MTFDLYINYQTPHSPDGRTSKKCSGDIGVSENNSAENSSWGGKPLYWLIVYCCLSNRAMQRDLYSGQHFVVVGTVYTEEIVSITWHLLPFEHNARTWQTDRQTDNGNIDSNRRNRLQRHRLTIRKENEWMHTNINFARILQDETKTNKNASCRKTYYTSAGLNQWFLEYNY